jgi:hypothetical protein
VARSCDAVRELDERTVLRRMIDGTPRPAGEIVGAQHVVERGDTGPVGGETHTRRMDGRSRVLILT